MKDKKLNKNLFVILPVLSILVVLAIGIFLVEPKIRSITQKQQEIKTEEDKKTLLNTKIQQLEELSTQRTELTAQLTAINEALPTQKDVPTLIIQIQKTAQDSDVDIQSIQLAPGKLLDDQGGAKAGPEIAINLSIRGNYEAIQTFLGKVFRGKRLINLESINLTAGNTDDSESGLTAAIIMNTFYQPLPPKPVDETEAVAILSAEERATYNTLQSYESLSASGTDIAAPEPTPNVTPESSASATPSPSPSATP